MNVIGNVAERIDDAAYLDRLGQVRADLATHEAMPRDGVPAKRAVEWLRVLAETWVTAEVPEAKADLLHAIYERITMVGRSILSVRLTQPAYTNGVALALPQVVMARPEGVGHAGTPTESKPDGSPVPCVRRPACAWARMWAQHAGLGHGLLWAASSSRRSQLARHSHSRLSPPERSAG